MIQSVGGAKQPLTYLMLPVCSAYYDLMTHSCQPQVTEQQGSSSSRGFHFLVMNNTIHERCDVDLWIE